MDFVQSKKHCVFQWILKVPRGQHKASWGGFWCRLGASWALLGASWASWGRLGSVLGASWGHLDRHMKKTLKKSSKNEPTRPQHKSASLPPERTCLSMGTGSAMKLKVISRSCFDHAPSILQTCFNQLQIEFRHISTLFGNFPNHS